MATRATIENARRRGFSDEDIVEILAEENARVTKARDSGFSNKEIIDLLYEIDSRAANQPPAEAGNIDLNNRPRVDNPDGTFSTVRSMSFQDDDGREVLVPTISDDGHVMDDEEAKAEYRRTGKHLGKFSTPEEANTYAEKLHRQQAQQYALPQPPAVQDFTRLPQPMAPGAGVMASPSQRISAPTLQPADIDLFRSPIQRMPSLGDVLVESITGPPPEPTLPPRPENDVHPLESFAESLSEDFTAPSKTDVWNTVRSSLASWVQGYGLHELEQLEDEILGRDYGPFGLKGRVPSYTRTAAEMRELQDDPLLIAVRQKIAELRATGHEISEEKRDIALRNPNYWSQVLLTGTDSAIAQLPPLAVSVAARSPALGTAMMFPTTKYATYGQMREDNVPPNLARAGSDIDALIEVLTEYPGMRAASREASPILRRIGETGAAEVPGEAVASFGQSVNQAMFAPVPPGVPEPSTMDRLSVGLQQGLEQLPVAVGSAVLQSGATSAAGHGLSKLSEALRERASARGSAEPTPEDLQIILKNIMSARPEAPYVGDSISSIVPTDYFTPELSTPDPTDPSAPPLTMRDPNIQPELPLATMPPPATTGSPAPGDGSAVGPTAPSTPAQGTALPPSSDVAPPAGERPLATALEPPAPPAPPASTGPAQTPAPAATAVSPAQEAPAGGAAKKKRAPKGPPPAQGKLFGSDGEVVGELPPQAPKVEMPAAPADVADIQKYALVREQKLKAKKLQAEYDKHRARILAVDEEYKRLRSELPANTTAEHQRAVDEAYTKWKAALDAGTDDIVPATAALADAIETSTKAMQAVEAAQPETPSDMIEETAQEFEHAAAAIEQTDPAHAAHLRAQAAKIRKQAAEKRKKEFKEASPPAATEQKTEEPKVAEITPAEKEAAGQDEGVGTKTSEAPKPKFKRKLFRGTGRASKSGAYNPMSAGVPILGEGNYYAFNEEGARQYGPNVEAADVELQNPLVITSDEQWRALTRRAGWKFPNPTGRPKEEQKADIARLRALVEADGHDGIVVDFDENEPTDMYRGNWIKTLRDVFGVGQVVTFKPPGETKPATAKPTAPPPASVVPSDRLEQKRAEREGERTAIRRAIDFMMAQMSLLAERWDELRAQFAGTDAKVDQYDEEISDAAGEFGEAETDEESRDALEKLVDKLEKGIAYITGKIQSTPKKTRLTVVGDETNALRRAEQPTSKSTPGPYSATREGEASASHNEQIWTDADLDPGEMAALPPPLQFHRAANLLKARYGFREITKEKQLNWNEAISVLKDLYVGLNQQASVMNVNPAEASLGGWVALKLVRKAGDALAYYDPATREIGLVRRNDSYTHEYAHALDDKILKKYAPELLALKGRLLTGKIRTGGTPQTLGEQVVEAFVDLINAMFFDQAKAALYVQDLEHKIRNAKTAKQRAALQKQLDTYKAGHSKKRGIESEYLKRARAFDGTPFDKEDSNGYWQRPTEMFARAFEAFIAWKIGGLPRNHPAVTSSNRMYNEDRIGQFASVYPHDQDQIAIFDAMERLVGALRDADLVNDKMAPALFDVTEEQYWKKHVPNMTAEDMQKTRSWLRKMIDQLIEAKNEMYQLGRNARARAAHSKKIREARLNAAGREGLNRWIADIGLTVVDWSNALASGTFQSIRGVVLSLNDKHPNHPAIKKFMDWFVTNPGSGKQLKGPVYQRQVQIEERRLQARLANIIENHHWHAFTDAERRQVRDLLVNAMKWEDAPEKVRQIFVPLDKLRRDLYDYNVKNGVEIGASVNGYLPRINDPINIEDNVAIWRRQAKKVYALVYENEIGSTHQLMTEPERLDSLLKYVDEIATDGKIVDARVAATAQKPLAKRIEKLRAKIDAKKELGQSVSQEVDELQTAVDELRNAMRDPWTTEAVDDWENRTRNLGAVPDFEHESRGPGGKYTKSRVLPPDTDAIMGDFMKTDVVELLATYINQTVRRVQFGKFFGNPTKDGKPLGWKLDEALQQLRDEYVGADGSTQRLGQGDVEELEKSIALATNRYNTNLTTWGLRAKSKVTAFLTQALLGRMLKSQISEPANIAIRSKNFLDAYIVFGKQLHDLGSALMKMPPFKNMKMDWLHGKALWRREFAEYMGIVSDHMTDQVMQMRYNTLYNNAKDAKRLGRFFYAFGVHGHNMSLRRAAAEIFSTRYIPKIAKRALSNNIKKQRLARAALNQLGLDASNIELLKELESLGKIRGMDALSQLRYLDHIRTAIGRFVDEAVQNPDAIDKPRWATQPEFSFMYGIMAFNYGFQRNILIGTTKDLVNTWKENPFVGAAQSASVALSLALLVSSSASMWIAGLYLFGDDDKAEREKRIREEWIRQAIGRSSLYGGFDPIANAFKATRYDRDLTQLTAGPIPALIANTIQAAMNVFSDRNSPNTPTAEYKATEALWRYGVTPLLIAGALTFASKNPLYDAMIGIGLPMLSSDRVTKPLARGVAKFMTGQEYIEPSKRAAAAAGDPQAKLDVQEATRTNKLATDPLLSEPIPETAP